MKKKISIFMALVLMLSTFLSINIFAANETYIATAQIYVYKNTSCNTRGTSSPAKAYNAYISKGDDVNIQKLTSSYAKIDYPTSSGRKTGYIKRSDYNNKLKKYSASSYDAKVKAFVSDSRWKVGTSWGGSQTSKISPVGKGCKGCCAYTADFAYYVFGATSQRDGTKFTNVNEIKSGDVLYVTPQHWMVVLYRNGSKLDVIHGNWTNGKVCRGTFTLSGKKIGSKTFSYGYHY